MSTELLQAFLIRFTEMKTQTATSYLNDKGHAEGISFRDQIRDDKKINERRLLTLIHEYLYYDVTLRAQKALHELIFADAKGTKLSDEFIRMFEKEVGLNVIRRHPGGTVLAFILTTAITFGGTLLAILLYESITASSFMTVLATVMPFMAALGPIGAVILAAAALTVAALLIYGAVVGLMAATTSKTVHVTNEQGVPRLEDSSSNMLGALNDGPPATYDAAPEQTPIYRQGSTVLRPRETSRPAEDEASLRSAASFGGVSAQPQSQPHA